MFLEYSKFWTHCVLEIYSTNWLTIYKLISEGNAKLNWPYHLHINPNILPSLLELSEKGSRSKLVWIIISFFFSFNFFDLQVGSSKCVSTSLVSSFHQELCDETVFKLNWVDFEKWKPTSSFLRYWLREISSSFFINHPHTVQEAITNIIGDWMS